MTRPDTSIGPIPDPPIDPEMPVDPEALAKAVETRCVHCGSFNVDTHLDDGTEVDVCRDCGLRTVGFIVDSSLDLDFRPRWAWRTPEDHERMLEYDSLGL